MNKTAKRIVVATVGCVILTMFLGWRGSLVSQAGEWNELQRSLDSELSLTSELVSAKLAQFESDIFNVVSAEYLQHNSHTPGVTSDLNDSAFAAVGVLELKDKRFETSWFSINPKLHDSVSQEFLRNLMVQWQGDLRQMERHHFIRGEDLKQDPMMVIFSRIELPNTQTAALAVAVMPGRALKLNSTTLRESFLWDSKGFIWGYQNPSYIGAPLKTDPLVQASMKSSDTHQIQFNLNGHSQLGQFAKLADSNLYVGLSRELTPVSHIFSSWWISLAIAFVGASMISFAALRWWDSEQTVIEMPAIVVEEESAPVTKPKMKLPPIPVVEDLDAIIKEDTIDPKALDPAPLMNPIAEAAPTAAPIEAAPVTVESSEAATVKESASVEAVLRRALLHFRQRLVNEDIEVRENLPAGLFVKAKPAQLQTALEEIIKNSLDAMKESATKQLSIETGLEGDMVRITIHDTGCGIAADDQDKIFDPFFTSSPETSRGLGLTVVKRLLELVGGQSRVQSTVGEGTAISLLIPAPGAQLFNDVVAAATPSPRREIPQEMGLSETFIENEDYSSDMMVMEPMDEIALNFEIRKPKVRMFD